MADVTTARRIEVASASFGALPVGFTFDLTPGYTSLVGPNNAGKSSILQLLFRTLFDDPEFGTERVAFVPSDRSILPTAMETGGRALPDYNNNLAASLRSSEVWPYDGSRGTSSGELARVLLTHTNYIRQVNTVDAYLAELGLPPMLIKGAQQLHFEDIQAHFQGSGLRALFPVLCALSDTRLRALLIDEPEASLEPSLQRGLRDLLVRESADRAVVVATQSHLFVNRADIASVCAVVRSGQKVSTRRCTDPAELLDIVFSLLGNSTEDLLLPGNFIVVEGASDQTIVDRALELLGSPAGHVKVLASDGISRLEATAAAIEIALRPIVTGDSPYAQSVVGVVDEPVSDADRSVVKELRRVLGSRLVRLPAPSLEEYLPASLYRKAGLVKDTELVNLAALKGDRHATRKRKGEIARAIAAAMVARDLNEIPAIRDAAAAAAGLRQMTSRTRSRPDGPRPPKR